MFEALSLTEHINQMIKHMNEINTAQWVKINELEKRIAELENKG